MFYNLVISFFEQQYGYAGKKAWKSTQNNWQKPTGRCKFHKTRCHRACYQRFPKNLDRVKPTVKSRLYSPGSTQETSTKKHSQKKHLPCFLPINILWLGLHKEKKQDQKRTAKWKHKSSVLENIWLIAIETQNDGCGSFFHKGTSFNLFAAEVDFQKSCYHNFYSK